MKFYLLISIIFLLKIIFELDISAQQKIDWKFAETLNEKLTIITDRDVYCVEETILFKIFNNSNESLKEKEWSKVLYMEIITPDGQSIAQGKFQYNSEGCSGKLAIPSSALTGIYYLRSYTRWMRNFSPYNYSYKPVKLINPFKKELLQPVFNNLPDLEIRVDSIQISKAITIETDQKEYKTREKVSVKISPFSELTNNMSVAVINEGIYSVGLKMTKRSREVDFTRKYLPETRGLSLSGMVINEVDSSASAYNQIHLTIFKANPEIMSSMADETGKFSISLSDLKGDYELYLTAKNNSNEGQPLILIDNDFCTRPVNLPFIPFYMSESEKLIYSKLCLNAQILNAYEEKDKSLNVKSNHAKSAFYGEPEFTLKMMDYIDLPTLGDYIFELIPVIGIRQKNRSSYLKVIGEYNELKVYDPLILIDQLAVYDIDRILAVSPKKIDRIEVVNVPYIRGDHIYGGIISFISKDGDLAGIDLPSWGGFIKYKFFEDQDEHQAFSPDSKTIPDTRNCLYWNPSLDLVPGKSTEFEFFTGDSKGKYIILIRGIDEEGNEIIQSESFLVKD